MEAEPVQFLWRHFDDLLDVARLQLAGFLSASPRDLVFVRNATEGVNAVVRSLDVETGDELLTTSFDYNACRNVLVETARKTRAQVVVASLPFPVRNEAHVVESILAAVTPRTRLAMIDHVTSDSGIVLPISRIVDALNERGVPVLVDGAHAPGMLPLNLNRLDAAYYTGNLHKWVCAPKGAAFLWVREDLQTQLQPPVISHGNNRSRSRHSRFQDRFDWNGTFDPSAVLSVPAAIKWLGDLLPGGWTALRRHNHELAVQGRQILLQQFETAALAPNRMLGSLATVQLPDTFQNRPPPVKIDPVQMWLYDRFGVEVPFVRIQGVSCLRISAQIYNRIEDYEFLAEALAEAEKALPRLARQR
jgi:isopenicillin-N epimerase